MGQLITFLKAGAQTLERHVSLEICSFFAFAYVINHVDIQPGTYDTDGTHRALLYP